MKQQRAHPLRVSGVPDSLVPSSRTGHGFSPQHSVTWVDRWMIRRLVGAWGFPPVAVALWDGNDAYAPVGDNVGRIVFHDRQALWSVLWSPEIGFGDGYTTGRIEIVGNLVDVLFRTFRSIDQHGPIAMKRGLSGRLPKPRSNTTRGSRKHIHQHYDLGNDFYRLWLDEHMVYTCGYYTDRRATLEQAQIAKMDHVARKLRLQPGQSVVEAGCGWGSLALHLAANYGVRVKAYNISTEQIAYARERALACQLDHRIEFVEDDYRNISGKYDAFVSVGMIEHVGLDHFPALAEVIRRSLKPDGIGLLHTVGRSRSMPPNAWLERRIFPGSHPPSLRDLMDIFEPHDFCVVDVENLRLHYAKTLVAWLHRFDENIERVREMYDERFVRAWRLHLGGCAAAFQSGSTQLFQVVFSSAQNNAMAMTRAHLTGGHDTDTWDL